MKTSTIDTKVDCTCLTVKHVHGTRDAYLTDGCRCPDCREATRANSLHYRRQKAYGRSRTHQVEADTARNHVLEMMSRGWSIDLICLKSGVARGTIARLLYGDPADKEPLAETIRASTHDRIMACNFEGTRKKFEGTKVESVDPTGTKRRIQALVYLGFSMTWLCHYVGKDRTTVSKILKSSTIGKETADLFAEVYDELWNKQPPQSTPAEKRACAMAKRIARENNWYPPMAWDDDKIDDPSYKAVA